MPSIRRRRFYTLNGFPNEETRARHGAGAGYDFRSAEAVRLRWLACIGAGVDFIATDQYEQLATAIRSDPRNGKLDDWRLDETVALRGVLHYVRGIDTDGDSLWVSLVDARARKGFLSRFELPTGRLLG